MDKQIVTDFMFIMICFMNETNIFNVDAKIRQKYCVHITKSDGELRLFFISNHNNTMSGYRERWILNCFRCN